MSTRALITSFAMAVLLGAGPGCGAKGRTGKPSAAPQGVVGQVLRVEGSATYAAPGAKAQPLKAGDLIRADWTLRTLPGARLVLLLKNGHEYRMNEDFEKRAGAIEALKQPALKRGALDGLDAYGGPAEIDRATAAGTYQERTAGARAFTSRPFTSGVREDPPRDAGMQKSSPLEGLLPGTDPTTAISPPVVPGTDAVRSVSDLTRSAPDLGRALARLVPFLKRCLLMDGIAKTQTVELEIKGVSGRVDQASLGGKPVPAGSCVRTVLDQAVFTPFPEAAKQVTFEVTIP
jgi:hypothetical protein